MMTSVRVRFVLIFAVVQLCTAEYRCHHPLITQLRMEVPLDGAIAMGQFSTFDSFGATLLVDIKFRKFEIK